MSNETYTIEQFIQLDSNNIIDYHNLAFYEKIYNGEFLPIYNVVNDYLEELQDVSVIATLDDKNYNKYLYKPKLLSYDIYGSQELYYIILALNGLTNMKEFNLRKVKLLPKGYMTELISYIYNAEKKNISENRERIGM